MFELFKATKDGDLTVRLDENLRELIRKVTEELREVLLVDDTDQVARLYPTAYPDDDELDKDYQEMVHDQLLMDRLDGIDKLQGSLGDQTLSVEMADVWMNTINQARLVLGTQLDVSEDDGPIDEDDPLVQNKVVYQLLSHILEDLTHARTRLL